MNIDDSGKPQLGYPKIPSHQSMYEVMKCKYIPNPTHGYSSAINLITNWFLSRFGTNFFKSKPYLSIKNIISEYRTPLFTNSIVKEPPLLAIIPAINFDYDRNDLDTYLAPMHVTNPNMHDYVVFHDPNLGIRISYTDKEIEMAVQYYMKLKTRAQQWMIRDRIEMEFRIGASETHREVIGYHIPKDLIMDIARVNGFRITKDGNIYDLNRFMAYLNTYSYFPITHKFHGLNNQEEFFMIVNNVYCRFNMPDKLQLDDGDMRGQTTSSYLITMNVLFHMIIPKFYTYERLTDTSKESIPKQVYESDVSVGLFDVCVIDPPKVNDRGWDIIIDTGYDFGDDEMDLDEVSIDITELFHQTLFDAFTCKMQKVELTLYKLIKEVLKTSYSPSKFLDVKVFSKSVLDGYSVIPDWDSMTIKVPHSRQEESIKLSIYVDKSYLNQFVEKLYKK